MLPHGHAKGCCREHDSQSDAVMRWSSGRIGRWVLKASARLGWAAASLIAMSAAARTQEGVDRWRLLEQDGKVVLFEASSDETDAWGSLSFSCTKGSGVVEVGVEMGEKERAVFADFPAHDQYPAVVLVPPDPQFSSLPELAFSEPSGWYYKFSISPEAKAFRDFTRTGALNFKVKSVRVEKSFSVGLDSAVKFQNDCRKSPPR
jgi:hypothetical protein